MSSSWYIIVIAALVSIAIWFLLSRRNQTSGSASVQQHQARPRVDYTRDREAARLANMSAEDRAWETATLQRNQENQQRTATLGT